MDENWMPVRGYEGQYEVSDLGRVRSWVAKRPGLILSQYRRKDGYRQVQLKINQRPKNVLVHVIADEAFNGERVEGFEVNHIDGNKENNILANLERVTKRQNIQHAVRIGLWGDRCGEKNSFSKLSKGQVLAIREAGQRLLPESGYIKRGELSALAKEYGISAPYCSSVVHGRVRVNG